MASRRAFKKDIQYLYAELLTECFTLPVLFPQVEEAKVDALMNKILQNCHGFVQKAGHPNGVDNPKLVKQYYKKIGEDLLKDVLDITKELEQLHQ